MAMRITTHGIYRDYDPMHNNNRTGEPHVSPFKDDQTVPLDIEEVMADLKPAVVDTPPTTYSSKFGVGLEMLNVGRNLIEEQDTIKMMTGVLEREIPIAMKNGCGKNSYCMIKITIENI